MHTHTWAQNGSVSEIPPSWALYPLERMHFHFKVLLYLQVPDSPTWKSIDNDQLPTVSLFINYFNSQARIHNYGHGHSLL